MLMRKWALLALLALVGSLLLTACEGETVEVTRVVKETVVEKETVIEKETVLETVIVEGTPEVKEVEVTREVVKEVMVTPTLPPTETPLPAGVLRDVARNRTLFTAGWDAQAQIQSPTYMSPYGGVTLLQRNLLHYTVNEMLFYLNYATGDVIPWQAEGWEYNDDYTELTINVRPGVEWADGEPFTAEDVVFTINMLKENSPDMALSSVMAEWVESAEALDDFTVVITLTKPGPRWALDTLATGQVFRFVVVPEHIWKDVDDPVNFEFYDIEQGWPVGTGPYHLVRTGDEAVFFDRLDHWWALGAGLVTEMPAPERIVMIGATSESLPNQYISNELDIGPALPIGEFEAARAQNPNLISWHDSGPVWGAPDGCVYRLAFNNQREPFNDVDVRWAINHAIDRRQIVELAYEGSTTTNVAPFEPAGLANYLSQMQELFDEYVVDDPDLDKTADILTSKGFTRDGEGYWVKPDGERFQITIIAREGGPIAPIVAQQLQDAGFDAVFEIAAGASFVDAATTGEFDIHDWVHCGSIYDPWQTLDHYHSKHSAPPGEPIGWVRAYTRYENPELDLILDQLESMSPSPDDAAYMDLVRQATEIYLRDLPDLTLANELHVITNNTTYWEGFPSADDPYMAPYIPWEGYNQVIHRLQPTQ